MEERNGPARFVCAEADLILICGSASLKGVRSIVNCRNDALRHGAEAALYLASHHAGSQNPAGSGRNPRGP